MNHNIGTIQELPLYAYLKHFKNYSDLINILENEEKEEILELAQELPELKNYLENVYQDNFFNKFGSEYKKITNLSGILSNHTFDGPFKNINPNEKKELENAIFDYINSSLEYVEAKGDYYLHLIPKIMGHDETHNLTTKELIQTKEDYNALKSSVLKNSENVKNYFQKIIEFNKNRINLFYLLNKQGYNVNNQKINSKLLVTKTKKLFEDYVERITEELFTSYL